LALVLEIIFVEEANPYLVPNPSAFIFKIVPKAFGRQWLVY